LGWKVWDGMDIEVYALVSAFIVAIREIVRIIWVVGIERIICKTVYRSIGIISTASIVIGAVVVSFRQPAVVGASPPGIQYLVPMLFQGRGHGELKIAEGS
jgi:hypothetical protein